MTPGVAGFGPDPDEAAAVATQFGVGRAQVERDHLISHVLAALGRDEVGDRIIFFGGTALSRTLLPELRLSEDIDLIARERRDEVAQSVTTAVTRALARTHGRLSWSPSLDRATGLGVSVLSIEGTAMQIQVQLLSESGYPPWPTAIQPVHQRYSDVPQVALRSLTADAFVAAKLAAWHDRGAARDLYDLWGLAVAERMTRHGLALYRRFGPTNRVPDASMFRKLPSSVEWNRSLAHQCRLVVQPAEAALVVREGLHRARELGD